MSHHFHLREGVIAGVCFSLGVLVVRFFPFDTKSDTNLPSIEHRESGYTFINPLLECEYANNQGNTKLQSIKRSVEQVVSQKKDQEISLYYRDLLNGPWYGYNEDAAFAPQSLLKLPIVFAYLKLADEQPTILQREFVVHEKTNPNLEETENLVSGEAYSVDTLIKRTLQLSDNVAFNLLVENLPLKFVEKVHQDLDIPYPKDTTPDDFISVRSYSSIFRVLYNASYLSRKHSEYLLDLLSQSEFKKGLVAGVPNSVTVAHKFGIKNQSEKNALNQLHDCGIIYHPQHPYLLCIMTKGTNQLEQTATIRELSKSIYQVIDQEK